MNDSRASCRPSSMRGSRVTEYGGTGSLEYGSVVIETESVAVSAAGVAGLSDEGGREEGLR